MSVSNAANLERAFERVRRATDSAGKEAFAARALYAVARLIAAGDEQALTSAAGAGSDYETLLQMLERPESLAMLDEGPLAAAKLRGLRYRERLLNADGGAISSPQVAEILGLSRQAVDKRRRAGQLLGLSTGRRGYAYPIWQFDADSGTLPGLETVLDALRDHDPWMQLSFMLATNARLEDQRPLDLLRSGQARRVRDAALMVGEQGAA